jgi:hypothetical protein
LNGSVNDVIKPNPAYNTDTTFNFLTFTIIFSLGLIDGVTTIMVMEFSHEIAVRWQVISVPGTTTTT